jgi:hypothetical protein
MNERGDGLSLKEVIIIPPHGKGWQQRGAIISFSNISALWRD